MFLFTDRAPAAPAAAPQGGVTPALRAASERTGTPFAYLLETARRESALRPDAKATTSSARGLFQFIEQTWLSVLRSDGATQGLEAEAAAISTDARGRLTVADPDARARILGLRNDPDVAARMAGVLAQKNSLALSGRLGRAPSQGELYIAHFLGSAGAAALIRLKERAPETPAVSQFPQAAAANRSVFFGRDGASRSVGEVYDRLVRGFETMPAPAGEMAVATGDAPSRAPFHSLFRSGDAQGVGPAVTQAWLPLARRAPAGGARAGAIGAPLDLLSFSRVRSRVS